jgi:hypothetical protein
MENVFPVAADAPNALMPPPVKDVLSQPPTATTDHVLVHQAISLKLNPLDSVRDVTISVLTVLILSLVTYVSLASVPQPMENVNAQEETMLMINSNV